MKESSLRKLNTNIKSELIKLGIDWQLAVGKDFKPVLWRAAPLYMAGKLFDTDLKELLHVGISLSFEDYLTLYEGYLSNHRKRKYKSQDDLRRGLGLTIPESDLLFPLGAHVVEYVTDKQVNTANNQRFAPALAILAYYNFGGEVEVANFDSLVVSVNGFRLGQNLGKVLSTNPETETVFYKPYSVPHVVCGRRRHINRSKLGERLSAVFRLLEASGLSQDILSDFEMGFTILLQNELNSEWLRNSWLVSSQKYMISDLHLKQALDTAKSMATFYNPREALREHLVPLVLTKTQFANLIGTKVKNADTALAAVLGLEQQLKSERNNLCL